MPGNLDDCICSFADLLGGAKSQIITMMNQLIALLETLKATLLLFSIDFYDEARKLEAQAELAVIQLAVDSVSAPFALILGYTKTLSDCDPVASLATVLKESRDKVLSDFYEREYELNQFIASLDDKQAEIDSIDRIILMLQDVTDALDECGS
jgi:hypothetical protein